MDSGKYSDLKLVCQGLEFKVHKAIICTQSPVLAAACDGGFQEAATNIININEFDSGTIKRMIQFMYKGDYDNGGEEQGSIASVETLDQELEIAQLDDADTSSPSKLDNSSGYNKDTITRPTTANITLRHVHVNAIADYYNIPQLKELANTKIQHILGTSWSADGFPDVVKDVFSLTGDLALHNIITFTAAKHIEELIKLEDFVELDVMSDFAIGIVRTAITAFKDMDKKSTQKLQAVQSQLQRTESLLKSAEARCAAAKRKSENIDGCLDSLHKIRTCRNIDCGVQFTGYIELGGHLSDPSYILRCSRCQWKHQLR